MVYRKTKFSHKIKIIWRKS